MDWLKAMSVVALGMTTAMRRGFAAVDAAASFSPAAKAVALMTANNTMAVMILFNFILDLLL
jgi:hypothetical protein